MAKKIKEKVNERQKINQIRLGVSVETEEFCAEKNI